MHTPPLSEPNVLEAGDLGKYRLIARLARGGMGDVYLAVARGPAGWSKLAVVKELRADLAEDPSYLEMFLDEARLAARLNHNNVVQTNEVGSEGRRHFMVMEYLEGQPLQRVMQRLARTGLFSLPMRLRVLSDALAGLHYAHELVDFDGAPLHVVHRDVSPHNVFVTYDGVVKVLDFGIAKTCDSEETRAGTVKGKAAYMAPEQALGRAVDRRADIFSAGVMLWEFLTNQRLWRGVPEVTVLIKVGTEQVPSPAEVCPDAPEELVRICDRALARDASARYETALDFRMDLERYIAGLGAPVTSADIGALIGETFADDRVRLRLLVETSTRRARSMPTGEFRAIDLARLAEEAALTSPGVPAARASMPSFASAISRTVPSFPSFPKVVLESLAPSSVDAPVSEVSAAIARPVPRAKRSGVAQGVLLGASIGLFAVLALGVALFFVARRGPEASAHEAPLVVASAPDPLAAAPPLTPTEHASPASADPTPDHAAAQPPARLAPAPVRPEPRAISVTPPSALRAASTRPRSDPPAAVARPAEPAPSSAPEPERPAPATAAQPTPPPASTVTPFAADMLRPKLLSGRDPVYTREALLARVQGTFIAKCTITTVGTVEGCRVLKPLPHMEQAVLEALRTRRYAPVIYQGRPTAVEYVFNVQLVLPS